MRYNETTISLPVKNYVKSFLIEQCGNPVDLKQLDSSVHDYFVQALGRKNGHNDSLLIAGYGETVEIIVTIDDLERFGKTLTKTKICRINSFFEYQIKLLARTYERLYRRYGYEQKDAIIMFQKDFKFDEEILPLRTIAQDLYRIKEKKRKISSV